MMKLKWITIWESNSYERNLQLSIDPIFFIAWKNKSPRFREKARCIGSEFEAVHQLAAIFRQGIVDYIFTNDSDLVALGTDIVTSIDSRGKCLLCTFANFLTKCFPTKVNEEILPHITRNPGNSINKFHLITRPDENTLYNLRMCEQ